MTFIDRDDLFDREQVMVDELAERIYKSPVMTPGQPKLTWFAAYEQAYEQLKERLTARNRFFGGKTEDGQ